MIAVMKREIKNYLKRPLFWIGFFIVLAGVFHDLKPYMEIHYIRSEERNKQRTSGVCGRRGNYRRVRSFSGKCRKRAKKNLGRGNPGKSDC